MRADAGTAARRTGLAASLVLVVLAFSLGSLDQEIGCNQKAHYALVRALAEGTAIVDEYQPESCDLAYTDGHYYAAKAPGLAFVVLPVYVALDAADAIPDNPRTAVWVLGLFGALLPALVAAAIAGRLADRVAPATGTFVAATLAVGTLLLPFATLFFAHALAAALAVGAFALLWRDRLAPATAALAGLLTGFAVVVEHPAALVAPRPRRVRAPTLRRAPSGRLRRWGRRRRPPTARVQPVGVRVGDALRGRRRDQRRG